MGAVRWTLDTSHANVDVYYYSARALTLSGTPTVAAETKAAAFTFSMLHPRTTGSYEPARLTVSSDPRYTGIFRARALFPAIAAVSAPALGTGALIATAFLAAVVAALVVGFAARSVTGSSLAAIVAVAVLLASPAGRYLVWVLADGTMLAFLAIAIAAASHYLQTGARTALAVAVVALVAVGATKIGNLDVSALALVAVGVGGVVLRTEWRARGIRLAAAAGAVLVAAIVVSAILGLPSAIDQVQDLLTGHFAQPDHANPIADLVRADLHFFPGLLRFVFAVVPLGLAGATIVAGVALLRRWREAWVWPWLASGAATAALIASHPVRSELDRLAAPLWLSVAIGVAVAVDAIIRAGRISAAWEPIPG